MQLISLLLRHLVTKLMSSKFLVNVSFKIWDLKRFWFTKSSRLPIRLLGMKIKSIKLGLIIPLLFSFFSNGILKVLTIGNTKIKEIPERRIHKKFKHMTEFDSSIIAATGPITNLLIALVLISINAEGFSKMIEVNYLLALFHLLPLPGIDGFKIFTGSRPLYLFIVSFSILSLAFIQLTNIVATLILSIILAFIIITFRLYKTS